MKKAGYRFSVPIMIISLFLITGCNKIDEWRSIPVNDILSNPREFEGKNIKISGIVGDPVTLIFVKMYVLGDKTGSIYVITDRILPRKGDKITVNGTVDELLDIGNQKITVFREASLK